MVHVPCIQISGASRAWPWPCKRHIWYTDLVLANLERSVDFTIGLLMANNLFTLVFTFFLRLFLPSFELWEKEEDPKLSAPIPVLLSPQVKSDHLTKLPLIRYSTIKAVPSGYFAAIVGFLKFQATYNTLKPGRSRQPQHFSLNPSPICCNLSSGGPAQI